MAAIIASMLGTAILIQFGFRGPSALPLRRLERCVPTRAKNRRGAGRRGEDLLLRLGAWAGGRLPRLPLASHADLLEASGTRLSEGQFRGLRLGAALGLTLIPLGRGLFPAFLLGPLTAGLGLQLPVIWLKRKAAKRSRDIASELPEYMDHLALLLAAGQGLGPALERCAGVGAGPLYQEMQQALAQVKLGRERADALEEMCSRNSSPELRRACRALNRAERFGGPIATSVAEIAADPRAARFQAARSDAARAPVKLLFPLVFMILPSFILLTVGGFVLSVLARW